MSPDPNQQYADAMLAEAAAWERARARLPGSGRFDAAAWQSWRAAQRKTELARKAVLAQTTSVRLSAAEVTRPGPYVYTAPGDAAQVPVRVLRTPTIAIVGVRST
ncbi:MAG: hypothetical protein EOO24_58980, partial [Comamonadaceae bacterium]